MTRERARYLIEVAQNMCIKDKDSDHHVAKRVKSLYKIMVFVPLGDLMGDGEQIVLLLVVKVVEMLLLLFLML